MIWDIELQAEKIDIVLRAILQEVFRSQHPGGWMAQLSGSSTRSL